MLSIQCMCTMYIMGVSSTFLMIRILLGTPLSDLARQWSCSRDSVLIERTDFVCRKMARVLFGHGEVVGIIIEVVATGKAYG